MIVPLKNNLRFSVTIGLIKEIRNTKLEKRRSNHG